MFDTKSRTTTTSLIGRFRTASGSSSSTRVATRGDSVTSDGSKNGPWGGAGGSTAGRGAGVSTAAGGGAPGVPPEAEAVSVEGVGGRTVFGCTGGRVPPGDG